jgi:hypothetical protein
MITIYLKINHVSVLEIAGCKVEDRGVTQNIETKTILRKFSLDSFFLSK